MAEMTIPGAHILGLILGPVMTALRPYKTLVK